MSEDWPTLKPATEIWANEWIKILETTVRLPTGVEAKFYMMDAADGVAVLALDKDFNAIVNSQYRPAVNKTITELPAGLVEDNEDFEKTAARELAEESGWEARDFTKLGSFYRNPGRDTGSIHVYFARVNVPISTHQERYESLETAKIPYRELVAKVLNNEIRDPATIFAVFMLENKLARGEIQL